MDSARYFDLLGESVPQVRVLAPALALLGFVNFNMCVCVCVCSFVPVHVHKKVAVFSLTPLDGCSFSKSK